MTSESCLSRSISLNWLTWKKTKDFRRAFLSIFVALPLLAVRYLPHDALRIYFLEYQLFQVKFEAKKNIILNDLISREAKAAGVTKEHWEKTFFDQNLGTLPEEKEMGLKTDEEIQNFRTGKQMALQDLRSRLRERLFEDLSKKYGAIIKMTPPTIPTIPVLAPHPLSYGDRTLPVKIVEFVDLECPYCKAQSKVFSNIRNRYGAQIYWQVVDLPAESNHPNAMYAHRALRCADFHNKSLELEGRIFQLTYLGEKAVDSAAALAEIPVSAFRNCMNTQKENHEILIRENIEFGRNLGLTGTPSIFINGRPFIGFQSEKNLAFEIKRLLRR
jgi:protein-disulfide isomerase